MALRALTADDLANLKLDEEGRYHIGSMIREGTVFKVRDNLTGEDCWWAAKVAPHPTSTKNRQSSLSHERMLYQVDLAHLQGTAIPQVPSSNESLPVFKENVEAGFDWLIIEQMHQELFPALESDLFPISRNAVLGPLCQRMLGILREIHESGFVVSDIKAENFMVLYGEAAIVERLRLVGLGLLKCYRLDGRHVDNNGLPEFRGTPKYASLNTHQLDTPSRRDDVEALLYLSMEMVIMEHARFTGQTDKYSQSNSFLPWSQATSDEDLGAQKRAQVSDVNSELYSRMPHAAAQSLKQCWDEVRSYEYKTTPDYEKIGGLLSTLIVPAAAAAKKRGAKRTLAASPGRPFVQRLSCGTPHRQDVAKAQNYPSDEKENKPAASTENLPREELKENRMYQAATLVATNGPYKGAEWVIQEGEDKLIFGKNPTNRAGYKLVKLAKDASVVDLNHARISLQLHNKKLRLDVWDIKGKKGTFINDTQLTNSHHAAFDGNVIKMGQTWLEVRRAPGPNGGRA